MTNTNENLNKTKEILQGALYSVTLGFISVLLFVFYPSNELVNTIGILVIPLIFTWIKTKRLMNALTLVWINELFFGASGTWVKIGGFPGRGLLIVLIFIVYLFSESAESNIKTADASFLGKKKKVIFFYGLVFPTLLLLYSLAFGDMSIKNVLSDVMRFSGVLLYFPLLYIGIKNYKFLFGWITGASLFLSILFILMAIGPHYIRIPLLIDWMNNGEMNTQYFAANLYSNTTRAAMVPIILCLIGIFTGLILSLTSTLPWKVRLGGLLCMLISISPFILNFLRGAIVGIVVVFIFFAVISIRNARNIKMILSILVILGSLTFIGYKVTLEMLPDALSKWDVAKLSFIQLVDPVRVEQTEKMLAEWEESPLFGKGAGAPVRGYSRTEESNGLAFEVQYPMVLYRLGIIGFVILFVPFFKMIKEVAVRFRNQNPKTIRYSDIFMFSIGLSICALLVASWTNPYFATAMTPFLIVLFYVTLDVVKYRSAHVS